MTKKKPKESLAELQKQREDIEALLASIEEAYSEGTMPEAQYQDVKAQNEEKLQEINDKLDKAAMEGGGEAPAEPPKEGEAKPEEPEPAETAPQEQPQPEPAATQPAPETQPVQESAPEPAPTTPEPAPTAVPAPVEQPTEQAMEGEQKTQQLTSATIEMPEEIREMIEGIKEGKIGGNAELLKRIDKVEVDIEKVKSFVDAMKDERTSLDERFQRVSEEVGEIRSNMNNMDGRLGELEIKTDESSDIIRNLKPQRISQALETREGDVKNIKARIEKIEDVISNTLKRVGEIRNLLQDLGSIDNLANMSKDVAKKVIMVDDSLKKMGRMSDRIDTIFGELNKRLEEFMFYKAKQQSLDEMTQDLMRNIEEMSTKMDSYVQKNDLNSMKDFLITKIEEAKGSPAAVPVSGPGAEIQKQIDEIKELNVMLEEQKKSGALGEKEYQKAKEANTNKMEELMNKMAEVQVVPAPSAPAPSPAAAPPEPAGQAAPLESAAPPPETPPAEPVAQPEPPPAEQAAQPVPQPEAPPQEAPAEPAPEPEIPVEPVAPPEEKKELVKEETPFGEMYKLEKKTAPPEVKPIEKPEEAPKEEPRPAKAEEPKEAEEKKEEKPAEEPIETEESEETEEEDEEVTTSIKKGMKKHERMLVELEDSFKKGLLSEKAYSKTKKMLEAMNN